MDGGVIAEKKDTYVITCRIDTPGHVCFPPKLYKLDYGAKVRG